MEMNLIKKFKELNKDSKKYLKGKRKLENKYKYLSQISPVPKEKDIEEVYYFIDKGKDVYIPYKFVNYYNEGRVRIACRKFVYSEHKIEYTDLTIEQFEKLLQSNLIEITQIIEKSKEYLLTKFYNDANYFLLKSDNKTSKDALPKQSESEGEKWKW